MSSIICLQCSFISGSECPRIFILNETLGFWSGLKQDLKLQKLIN